MRREEVETRVPEARMSRLRKRHSMREGPVPGLSKDERSAGMSLCPNDEGFWEGAIVRKVVVPVRDSLSAVIRDGAWGRRADAGFLG
jgi:hypothetical protein